MKNVVLITVDSLRADHLSCYGYERETSPNIDALARDGTRYTMAFTQGPRTPSSFPALIGGIYPLAAPSKMVLPRYCIPLQSIFKRAGYVTAAFHSNPWVSRFKGYDRDFSTFFDSFPEKKGEEGSRYFRRKLRKRIERILIKSRRLYFFVVTLYDLFIPLMPPYLDGGKLNQRIRSFINGTNEPLFLWVHYMDTHNPFLPTPDQVRSFTGRDLSYRKIRRLNRLYIDKHKSISKHIPEIVDFYDTSIRIVDSHVGKLLHMLRSAGLYDDSVIALTADHGEAFLEHGSVGHRDRFYEENIRVPLIIHPGSGTSNNMVGLIDLPPTLSHMAGIPTSSTFMGSNLEINREAVFSETWTRDGDWRACIRTRRWKLHWYRDEGKLELYDLRDDPEERIDLSKDRIDLSDAMRELLLEHVEDVQKWALRRTVQHIRQRHRF